MGGSVSTGPFPPVRIQGRKRGAFWDRMIPSKFESYGSKNGTSTSEGGPIQHLLLKSHRMAHCVVLEGDDAQAGKGNKIKITVHFLSPSASYDDASRNPPARSGQIQGSRQDRLREPSRTIFWSRKTQVRPATDKRAIP